MKKRYFETQVFETSTPCGRQWYENQGYKWRGSFLSIEICSIRLAIISVWETTEENYWNTDNKYR
jgi:hypothetical protein